MKKIKSRLSVFFLILFLPMMMFAIDSNTTESNNTIVDTNVTTESNNTIVDTNLTYKIGIIQPIPMELVENIKSIDMQINHLLFLAQDLITLPITDMNMSTLETNTGTETNLSTVSTEDNISIVDVNRTDTNATDMNITTLETVKMEVSHLSLLIGTLQNDINLTITDENLSSALQQEVSIAISDVETLSSLITNYQDNNETNLTMVSQEITTHLLKIQKFFREIPVDIYTLNTTEINNTAIIETIKVTIEELKMIRAEIESIKDLNGSALQQRYDELKQKLDGAKSKIDAIKQAIDMNIIDNNEILALKAEADRIKLAIDEIKTMIEGYKSSEDNTIPTIGMIQTKIDEVIGMLITHTVLPELEIVPRIMIEVPKGRSLISGNIDVAKLSSDIYAVWIVDGGNWYGYSPDASVRDSIKAKYRLIDKMIPAYKAVIVWANADTTIEVENDTSFDATQYYGSSFSIHGANNQDTNADNIICNTENDALTAIFKVQGDVLSAYLPNAILEGIENFTSLYYNEGYYVLCEQKLGASNE